MRLWLWHRGPTSNLIATVALVVGLVVPFWIHNLDAADANNSSALQATQAAQDLNEQKHQSSALDGILKKLSGANPLAAASAAPSAQGCRNDGERFPASWGPARPIYTDSSTPTYPLFNSVRDDPNIGDERAFYGIRDSAVTEHVWYNHIEVEKGRTYLIRIFLRNDAASIEAIATATRVMVNLPTCTGTSIASSGFVTSDIAFPSEIHSDIEMHANAEFSLAYVEGSAKIESNAPASPVAITSADFLTSKGQLVGLNSLDGIMHPGYSNDLYFTFEIRPQFAP